MLELDDIQGLLIHGRIHGFARYLFVRLDDQARARRWLGRLAPALTTAQPFAEPPHSCLTFALTAHGLQALGVAQETLDSFPEEFRVGMPARAELLGDTGASSPAHWQGGLATPALHAALLLFAHDAEELERCSAEQRALMADIGGLHELSAQDATRLPGRKEHFGYREGISEVVLEGSGKQPLLGQGPAAKAGEFFLGYPDESGCTPPLPQPAVLGRNGCFVVYRKLYQDVAGFRQFLHSQASDAAGEELLAAKLMGRWRSGAPLVLAPHADDPALAEDAQRSSDFNYAQMDPHGLACPIGAHVRRANPRDAVHGTNRNRLIRRGLPYGPPLPAGAPDDGIDRGVAVLFGNASIARQFEFVQRVWLNERKFGGLNNDKDPIVGDNNGSFDMTIQRRPFRRRITGLPRFVTVRGGAYLFVPSLTALRYLAQEYV